PLPAGGVTSTVRVPPGAAWSAKLPSAAVVATVDGTPSLTSRTVAPSSGTSAGPGPRTVPENFTPASTSSATLGAQFGIRRGARSLAAESLDDGTTSTLYGPGTTSWTEATPDSSANASTIASGVALGENCRYAGTPPAGPSTTAWSSRPDSTLIA